MPKPVSIIIPTLNGGDIFRQCLEAIKNQEYDEEIQLIVIDSGSQDESIILAEKAGAQVININKKDFHHSRTRNHAVKLAKHEYIVLMVQDAIPTSNQWLSDLCNSLETDDVVAVYGVQVPHDDADLYSRYELDCHQEYMGDMVKIQQVTSKILFNSMTYDEALLISRLDNVCAIYRRETLVQYPLPDIAYAEDLAWAKRVILEGYKVKYDPKLKVKHSHSRSVDYRFRRAIVDTVYCAEILERLSQDLSFVQYEQLLLVDKVIETQRKSIHQTFAINGGVTIKLGLFLYKFKKIIKRLKIINKVYRLMFFLQKKDSYGDPWLNGIAHTSGLHFQYILNDIKLRFPEASDEDLLISLDSVAAVLRGRIYGNVLASYRNAGYVPKELSNHITHFMRGV